MAFKELPARPSLEQYKKQAKDLLKRYEAGDIEALSRVSELHPHFRKSAGPSDPRTRFALSDAQWVIAREHGFESWPKFATHIKGAADRHHGGGAGAATVDVRLQIKTDEIHACAFAQDGKRAVTGAQGNPVQAWDLESGRCLRAFDDNSVHAWAVAATPDGSFVLFGARDGTVRMVEAESGHVEHVLAGHRGFIRCLDLARDTDRLLSGSGIRDPTVRLWDVKSQRCLRILDGHTDGVYDVALDVDQRRAVSGSRDTTVRVWDLESGRCQRVLEGHTYHVHSVAWCADGRRVLSSSRDIRLWDVETGQCLGAFEGHTDTIRSVVWSRDQRRVLSASHDGTVRIWDVERGTCLQTLAGHDVGLVKAEWSSDGRRVFSCDWNGSIRIWDLSAV